MAELRILHVEARGGLNCGRGIGVGTRRATPLVADEELITSDKELLRATAEPNVSSRNPDALQLDRAAPSEAPRLVAPAATFEESRRPIQHPAGIAWSAPETKSGRASGDMTEPATPRGLSDNVLPDRLTPAPSSRGSMANDATAHASDEPKTAQRGAPLASQRSQEPLPQFAASAQPNAPAPTPDAISAPLQVGNVSAAADGRAEVPVKLALATRDSQVNRARSGEAADPRPPLARRARP